MEINLKTWSRECAERIAAFEHMWGKNRRVNPADWPDRMSRDEWFEQFVVWLESEGDVSGR